MKVRSHDIPAQRRTEARSLIEPTRNAHSANRRHRRELESRPKDAGSYMLLLFFDESRRVAYGGRLRKTVLLRGLVVYVGNARGGIEKRLAWHLDLERKREMVKQGKKLPWHVDAATLVADRMVALSFPGTLDECRLLDSLRELPGATIVRGFGDSDCTNGCGGHLVRLPRANEQALVAAAERYMDERRDLSALGIVPTDRILLPSSEEIRTAADARCGSAQMVRCSRGD